MDSIVPCRAQVSDRFPVASFDVAVDPARCFEVACATDPRLFHPDWARQRTPANFYSSRPDGLLRAPDGRTAWFVPPEQLRRFAGAQRVYYALGSYGSPRGEDARFTIAPEALEQVPSVGLAADFTGRALDRGRLGRQDPAVEAYGGVGGGRELSWGGDDALRAYGRAEPGSPEEYDDGYGEELWQEQAQEEATASLDPSSESADEDAEPYECLDPGPDEEMASAAGLEEEDLVEDPGWAPPSSELDDDEETAAEEAADASDRAFVPDEGPEAGVETSAPAYGRVATTLARRGAPVRAAAEDAASEASEEDEEGVPPGRDVDYREEPDDRDELLPVGSAAAALSAALETTVLDIPEKVRLLRVVAVPESGRAGYAAVNADSEYNNPKHPAYHRYHIGLSWGFIQFTQRSGSLGRVLNAIKRRDEALAGELPAEHRFAALFGPAAEALLGVTNAGDAEARVQPVAGATLWEPVWTDRFRAAGAVDYVTWAQNEVAIKDFVDPNLQMAAWLGFDTPRALAMLVDRCIHMGNTGGLSWIMRAVGPVHDEAELKTALHALDCADVREFQQTRAGKLAVDGRWGPRTHAALTGALRALPSSPIPVADRDTMLRRLIEAAAGRRFQKRLRRLQTDTADFDDSVTYDLP